MRFNSILPLWRSFRALPARRRMLLLEAAFWLAAARLAVLLIPFPRMARTLGKLHAPAISSDATGSDNQQAVARDVSWAIDRAARLFPFKLVCLPRALAGWQMLRHRNMEGHLHFGAFRGAGHAELRTHAWLDACGVEVCGYPEAQQCVELAYFAVHRP